METVCLDFDGVVHFNAEFHGSVVIAGDPVEGVREAIKSLREHFNVVIHSCRCNTEGGEQAIRNWLEFHEIEVDDVIDFKPVAAAYIDDKAIQFKGDWSATVAELEQFKPWNYGVTNKYIRPTFRMRSSR